MTGVLEWQYLYDPGQGLIYILPSKTKGAVLPRVCRGGWGSLLRAGGAVTDSSQNLSKKKFKLNTKTVQEVLV